MVPVSENIEHWVRLREGGIQVAILSPQDGVVHVGESTMAMLRGETSQALLDKYGNEAEGAYAVVADDREDSWPVSYPVMAELFEGIGFTKLRE